MKQFGYTKNLNTSFLEAVDDIIFALKEQGFGILHTIDIQARIKEKLGKDIEEYLVLGACNPSLADEALGIEYEIGLFLPCNVIVYKKDSRVFVSSILPTQTMGAIDNKDILNVATKVEQKLKNAIDSI